MPTLTATITILDAGGQPLAGETINYRLVAPPAGAGGGYDRTTKTSSASDGAGLISVTLLRPGYEYQAWYRDGARQPVITPDEATMSLPSLTSARTG
jgi:hypothetical protein